MDFSGIALETLEGVSSIAMTAMSTIVASVALLFSYRQNAGWKPLALIVGQSMSGVGGGIGIHEFEVHIEFWNRRRYPVVVRGISVNVDGFKLKSNEPSAGAEPYVRGNCLIQKVSRAVNPGDQFLIKLPFGFENESLDAMRPLFSIELSYFDPHAGRERRLKIQHKHFYPELGWKLDEAQREEARQRYFELNSPKSSNE